MGVIRSDFEFLRAPDVLPALDPAFRPAALANRAFREEVAKTGRPAPVTMGIEQADGSVFHYHASVLPDDHPRAAANLAYIERLAKFLLWSRGGFRIYFSGPAAVGKYLRDYYATVPAGVFDADIMGNRIYERPFDVALVDSPGDIPPEVAKTAELGRHLDGCRIGFDLGASDRKAAAVVDGKVVFSEEVVWNPVAQGDPQWHFNEIMHGLKSAAAHMPRVDAIGGSAAGVYVNNRVKVASLFRGVPKDVFNARAKDLFLDIKKAWNDIPFELANDGEVAALAGSMSMGDNNVLGIAMGSSEAGGYVDPKGRITSWLNELAFTPIDYNPRAPVDEWSGDYGCGVQYLSQQCVARLLPAAGIEVDPKMTAADKLKHVQDLMDREDARTAKIYRTIGAYFGYAVAHYAEFYDIRHVLVLGRVTSGPGGAVIVDEAGKVLRNSFPHLAGTIQFNMPDEKDKRHGQAIAAASLPVI